MNMKLSEAIRLGAMLRPQCRNSLLSIAGGSCAFGAALEAVGFASSPEDLHDQRKEPWYIFAPKAWPIVDVIFPDPVNGDMHKAMTIIAALNNAPGDAQWTRERIADWVAEQERAIEAQQLAAPVELPVEVSA